MTRSKGQEMTLTRFRCPKCPHKEDQPSSTLAVWHQCKAVRRRVEMRRTDELEPVTGDSAELRTEYQRAQVKAS